MTNVKPGTHPIDTAWFRARVEASEYGSFNALAPNVTKANGQPMDRFTISKIMSGKQAMTLAEAYQFAQLLGLDFTEVCLRALGKKKR